MTEVIKVDGEYYDESGVKALIGKNLRLEKELKESSTKFYNVQKKLSETTNNNRALANLKDALKEVLDDDY